MHANLISQAFASSKAPDFSSLEALTKPPIHTLMELVHDCSDNPVDRTVVTTAFVLSCCQLAEGKLTPLTPSLILVNANGQGEDPIADFVQSLVAENRYYPPQSQNDGAFAFMEPEDARVHMLLAIHQMRKYCGDSPYETRIQQGVEKLYFAAQRTGFGSGKCRPYASAWHEEFGLLSDHSCRVILHLGVEEDEKAFRKDALNRLNMLIHAVGIGPGLQDQQKLYGIAGAIGENLWDAKLASALVKLPLPMMVLAHSTTTPLKLPDANLIGVITDFLRSAFENPPEEPYNFLPTTWCTHYAGQLRKRLRHLPGDYEHTMQRLARQLYPVCRRLAAYSGRTSSFSGPQIKALALDLYAHTLRGITISMAGLAWHGLGFDAGCPPKEVARVLGYLRKSPPMNKTELRRNAHIESKEARDNLLKHFLEEDLVRIDGDGDKIRVTTFMEFVTALHTRAEFPFPEDHCLALQKSSAAATA